MAAPYRVLDGQTYGWDCVLALGAAWFLDDGEGTEAFAGTIRGLGLSLAPLHLVRVDLRSGMVRLTEVCGLLGGLVANPPLLDVGRRLVVAYDSGNGVMACFDADTLEVRWRREQDHASHLLLYAGSGELVTGDGNDVVVLDIDSGTELARVDPGHGMQSVLFPCPGAGRDFYVTSFGGVSRIEVVGLRSGPGFRPSGLLRRVAHRFDVVAVRIPDEGAVVVGVVLGPQPGLVEDLGTRRPCRLEEGADRVRGPARRRRCGSPGSPFPSAGARSKTWRAAGCRSRWRRRTP